MGYVQEVDWGSLRTLNGVGMDPAPIGVMLSAPDSKTANEAYWGIEGTAFYSRQLEEAALPVTRVLVDAVCDGECTYWGTVYATDALVELTYECDPAQPELDGLDLPDKCLAVVRTHLPRLYQMLNETTDDMVLSNLITIVCNVEDDTPARRALLERLSHQDLDVLSADEVSRQLVEEHQRQEQSKQS